MSYVFLVNKFILANDNNLPDDNVHDIVNDPPGCQEILIENNGVDLPVKETTHNVTNQKDQDESESIFNGKTFALVGFDEDIEQSLSELIEEHGGYYFNVISYHGQFFWGV